MNPLSARLDQIADLIDSDAANIEIFNDDVSRTLREAAAEIAIASNTVQASTFLALTTAEKFAEVQRRNDELLQRMSEEVEAHRRAKFMLGEALGIAERAVGAAEHLDRSVKGLSEQLARIIKENTHDQDPRPSGH